MAESSKGPTVRRHTVCDFRDPGTFIAPFSPSPSPSLQVHLQTQQEARRGLWKMGVQVVRTQGARGLYNGLTASLSRQVSLHTPLVSLSSKTRNSTSVVSKTTDETKCYYTVCVLAIHALIAFQWCPAVNLLHDKVWDL